MMNHEMNRKLDSRPKDPETFNNVCIIGSWRGNKIINDLLDMGSHTH